MALPQSPLEVRTEVDISMKVYPLSMDRVVPTIIFSSLLFPPPVNVIQDALLPLKLTCSLDSINFFCPLYQQQPYHYDNPCRLYYLKRCGQSKVREDYHVYNILH